MIGQKIKQFRISKDLTQQELELAIGASSGHISRIESGKVDPSKETLLKIAKVLKLTQSEKNFLLGVGLQFPSEEDIKSAIIEAKPYLDNCKNIAYLSDHFWFVWDVNQILIESLGFGHIKYKDLVPQFRGSHLCDWIFNSDLGFRKLIPQEIFKLGAQTQVVYFLKEANYETVKNQKWMRELLTRCMSYPDFKEVWGKALSDIDKPLRKEEKYWFFKFNNKPEKFYLSEIQLTQNPHFEIIEYILQKS